MPRTTVTARLAATLLATGVAVTGLAACGSTTGGPASSAEQTASAVDQNPGALLPPSGVPAGQATPDTGGSIGAGTSAAAVPTDTPSAAGSAADGPATAASTAANTPAVANASDLTKQPVIAKGTGAPSTALVTKDLVVGKGTAATEADMVDVKYVGTIYTTGKIFDASWTRSPTDTTFSLTEVVPGFGSGIVGMKPGGRREIVIPAALGYGPSGGQPQAGISATDTIVFVVDLLKASAS